MNSLSSVLGIRVILGLAIVSTMLCAAILATNDISSLDHGIILMLRSAGNGGQPYGPPWVDSFVRDVTALGSFGILALSVLSVTTYLVLRGKRADAVFVFVTTCSGWLLSHALKFAVVRGRPDIVPHGVTVTSSSFPSGHSMNSAIVYLTFAVLLARSLQDPRLARFAMSLALIVIISVGLSRVYLGVHWPSDVLGGWAFGAIWVLLAVAIHRRFTSNV